MKLVIKIDGRVMPHAQRSRGAPLDLGTRAIIRELTQSLAMHGGIEMPGDTRVPPPPIVRQLPKTMTLRDLPSLLKVGLVNALSNFLAVETSAELSGALNTLSTQYADVVPEERRLAFAEKWYRDVAAECWDVIGTYG